MSYWILQGKWPFPSLLSFYYSFVSADFKNVYHKRRNAVMFRMNLSSENCRTGRVKCRGVPSFCNTSKSWQKLLSFSTITVMLVPWVIDNW